MRYVASMFVVLASLTCPVAWSAPTCRSGSAACSREVKAARDRVVLDCVLKNPSIVPDDDDVFWRRQDCIHAAEPAGSFIAPWGIRAALLLDDAPQGDVNGTFMGTVSWSKFPSEGSDVVAQACVHVGRRPVSMRMFFALRMGPYSLLNSLRFAVGDGPLGQVTLVPGLRTRSVGSPRSTQVAAAMAKVWDGSSVRFGTSVPMSRATSLAGQWIDLPVAFEGGRKGRLVFQTGPFGASVIHDVLGSLSTKAQQDAKAEASCLDGDVR